MRGWNTVVAAKNRGYRGGTRIQRRSKKREGEREMEIPRTGNTSKPEEHGSGERGASTWGASFSYVNMLE